MSVENISTLVYKNKKRSVDTLYQIVYNKSSDEFTVAQIVKRPKKNKVLCSNKITLAKIVTALKYNFNCSIITLVPEGSVMCYDFDREQLQNWVNELFVEHRFDMKQL